VVARLWAQRVGLARLRAALHATPGEAPLRPPGEPQGPPGAAAPWEGTGCSWAVLVPVLPAAAAAAGDEDGGSGGGGGGGAAAAGRRRGGWAVDWPLVARVAAGLRPLGPASALDRPAAAQEARPVVQGHEGGWAWPPAPASPLLASARGRDEWGVDPPSALPPPLLVSATTGMHLEPVAVRWDLGLDSPMPPRPRPPRQATAPAAAEAAPAAAQDGPATFREHFRA
jgi:hypothetical protein